MAFILLIAVFAFTGCNTVQTEYWTKMKEASNWGATDIEQVGNTIITVMGEEIKVDFKTTGYMNQKTLSGHLNMQMDMKMPEALAAELPQNPIKVTMDMYIVDGKVYFHKSYFQQIFTLSGMELPENLKNMDAEYIGIKESNELVAGMMQLMSEDLEPEKVYKLYEEVQAIIGVDIPVTKEGNTYTISLNKEQIVEITKKLVDSVVKNMDKLNEKLELELTKEDISQLQESYNAAKEESFLAVDEMLQTVDGKIKSEVTFDKEQMTNKFTFNVNVPEFMSMEMVFNQKAIKTTEKVVAVPGKTIELSEQELGEMFTPEMPEKSIIVSEADGELIDDEGTVEKIKVITKDNVKYVPAKAVLEALGMEVGYDKATRTAYTVVENTQVKVNEVVDQNKAYVSLDTLIQMGIQVENNQEYQLIFISK